MLFSLQKTLFLPTNKKWSVSFWKEPPKQPKTSIIFKNAQQSIEFIPTQEVTQQHAHAAKRIKMDAYTEQQRSANIVGVAEEARKTLDPQLWQTDEKSKGPI